jgi:hypothetical protein
LRGKFREWTYYTQTATAFQSGQIGVKEWTEAVERIVAECGPLGHHAICSPSVATKIGSDDELAFDIQVGDELARAVQGRRLQGLQTVVLRTARLEANGRPEIVASILTTGMLERLYIVPRWGDASGELSDAPELIGFAKTIVYLRDPRRLLVGFCGPEMILWKAAGAKDVATGKYGNQQRFDLGRYQEKTGGGGGAVAYYFEESLLAWLRFEDIVTLDRIGYRLGLANDPFLSLIRGRIEALKLNPPRREQVFKNGKPVFHKNGKPKLKREGAPDWTSYGWCQWLWWFADVEHRLNSGGITARQLVDNAKNNWAHLRVNHFLPADAGNDGRWLNAWSLTLDAIDAASR